MPRFRYLSLVLLLVVACAKAKEPVFRTAAAVRGPIVESVTATGDLSAVVTVNVGSQVSGIVSKLFADYNTPVKRGQLLAELDPRLFKAALERADAALRAAQANVEAARVNVTDAGLQFGRTKALVDQKLDSQADLDDARAKRDGAKAALDAALAQVQLARADRDTAATNVSLCRITSPIDGIVISRNIDVGQTVAAAFQAPTLFTIANDLTRMQVLANIDEADVGKVHAGLPTSFTVDAFPGEKFFGKILDVRSAPITSDNVVTYQGVIDAQNPERKLRQGMTAQVTIVTARRPDALKVPDAALRFHPAGAKPPGLTPGVHPGAAPKVAMRRQRPEVAPKAAADPPVQRGMVYRLVGGRPVATPVTLGISDGRDTEVLSGLSAGDQVILGQSGGAMRLRGPRAIF